MTAQEAIAYINNFTWSSSRMGLERTAELLQKVGDPQKKLKFIHVAGTNGKGSTCAMTERILREAGYRTGFYPSPYLQDFRERIQVNGEYIPGEKLAEITERVAAEAGHIFLRLIKGGNYSQRINAEMDRVRERVTNDQDPWIGVPCWSIGFSQYERKVFEEKTELEFEGKKFFVPKQYDYLLTRWYDDYMELPPEKDRIATHHYKMYKRSN